MSTLSRSDLLRLARTGAEARARELVDELDAIYRSFPGLQRARQTRGGRGANARTRKRRSGGRKRSGWSAVQRKAVSDRMRKYWAAKKAAEKAVKKAAKKRKKR